MAPFLSESPRDKDSQTYASRRASLRAGSAVLLGFTPFVGKAASGAISPSTHTLPSKITWQALELAEFYRALVAKLRSEPNMGISRTREIYEHWGDIGAEPGGVDYEETDINGMFGIWARPKARAGDRVILCTHGGGYRVGSPYSHRKLYAHLAKKAGAQALVADYRRVPEATFPAAVQDATVAYRHLLSMGFDPQRIAIAGDSAGGCLALTTALSIRQERMPLPACILSMSPAIDPFATGNSYEANKEKDYLLSRNLMRNVGKGYLATDADAKHPLATPLNADMSGMPPIYVQVGGAEVLLDDSLRLAELARAAGVEVKLDIYPDMQHVFQMGAGFVPEADAAIAEAAAWLRQRWDKSFLVRDRRGP